MKDTGEPSVDIESTAGKAAGAVVTRTCCRSRARRCRRERRQRPPQLKPQRSPRSGGASFRLDLVGQRAPGEARARAASARPPGPRPSPSEVHSYPPPEAREWSPSRAFGSTGCFDGTQPCWG
eukprot:scaffold279331_cov22-Tisochrysis_lutea.AAC.2